MASNLFGSPITLLFVLLVGSFCLFLVQHILLSEEMKAESKRSSNFDRSRFSFSLQKFRANRQRSSRRRGRSLNRRWDAWNNESSVPNTAKLCNAFRVFFDRAPRHGCIVPGNMLIPFCQIELLRIDVTKIESAVGGEELSLVMGRLEELEYPRYHPGALTISRQLDVVPSVLEQSTFHYIRDVLSAMTVERTQLPCAETWSGTTLFITRYEYANLFHAATDLFNTFFSYPEPNNNLIENNDEQVNLVFLDAHAKGNLDSVWRRAFGSVFYVKHLPKGGVCFKKAIFVPSGYVSPLFPMMDRFICPNPTMMEDFANHFLASYGLEHVQIQRGKIVIIDRVPYVSNPRSNPDKSDRSLHNLNHLPAYLQALPNVQSAFVVHFEELTFEEQLQLVREAHVLIGNHGAGLTHMVFMSDGSHVVEFNNRIQIFSDLAQWKPHVTHHLIQPVNGDLSKDYIDRILLPTIQGILKESDTLSKVL